ncbi:hypothetical protein DPMN_167483 [Dreissena polymorpha]|uniref:Uncharacterized protein n=1 Tax=Dreissena polymorpha TaxID=45954 RepID=A0A9D4F0F2_DREPO|nr:hypothetical protein DPMN_167483 [Dreissena polymorpha]
MWSVQKIDCLARLRGYRDLALVDTDEYLISNRGLTWMLVCSLLLVVEICPQKSFL